MRKQRKMNRTLRLNSSDNQSLKCDVSATVSSTAYGNGRLVGWVGFIILLHYPSSEYHYQLLMQISRK